MIDLSEKSFIYFNTFSQNNETDTTILRLVHTKVIQQYEDKAKLAEQMQEGQITAVKEGRTLKVEGDLMPLLVSVKVEGEEENGLPKLSNVTFSDSTGRVRCCPP